MFPTKNIVPNAVNLADDATLVAGVKATGSVDRLQALDHSQSLLRTNEVLSKLPAGTVGRFRGRKNKDRLTNALTYHALAEERSAADLKEGTLRVVLTAWKAGRFYFSSS
jgi:uncharacterized surface protein with fasciclin (FAS1) repeats